MNTFSNKSPLRKFPHFVTLSEVKRVVWIVNQQQPHARPGQAFCNVYIVSKELEDKIYELTDITDVAKQILFSKDNQEN